MLLIRVCWLSLLLALVAGSEKEAPEEVKTAEPQDVSDLQGAQPVAQDRSAAAELVSQEVPDQIAIESVDRHAALYAPHRPLAIPIPLPLPVSPGSLVLPGHPKHVGPHASPKEGTGSSSPHRPFGPPKRQRPPFRPPPPPPVFPGSKSTITKHPSIKSPHLHQTTTLPHPRQDSHHPHHSPLTTSPTTALLQHPPPQNSYNGPPQNSYNGPPPQNSYNGPPPPLPPQNSYSGPPPPIQPQYSAPPPSPQPTYSAPPPDPSYGAPKQADVFPGDGTHPPAALSGQVIAPAQAPVAAPQRKQHSAPEQASASQSQPIYNLPPVPAAAPLFSQVPISAPVPGPAPGPGPVDYSVPDVDVSGSANSYVPPESLGPADPWPTAVPEMPKITALDVKCEKNLMKVSISFDKPFYGIVFSKGHYSNVNCVHLPAGLGRSQATFDVSINACGTTGNTENGLYGYGSQSGSGTFFENTIVVQYDPQVQEVWDQARKLRCTWHDQYEKSVTFRPFPVDMLDVVRADFAGDNVGCWMQIQVGKGPWASEVSGLVKIGQTMTMVLAIKDDDNKFDMLVRNCMAHDGKRAPIQLVDQRGCVTRPKLMSKFTKIKNFGSSASVLSYAHFQAFKFPDSMEVHFQCTIQICRYQCPAQCSDDGPVGPGGSYEAPGVGRTKREVEESKEEEGAEGVDEAAGEEEVNRKQKDIGVNRVIQVVSTRDLSFVLEKKGGTDSEPRESETATLVAPQVEDHSGLICMSTPGFAATLIVLLAILIVSCLMSAFLCLRFRGQGDTRSIISSYDNPAFLHKKGHF
ncbi:LOW QUALITY PROTEIN: uncharacterized protein LOC121866992 [Homarus americanus]|uniref:LOW QUALITY PROTEIN: uncharacterized protein LOC121866992 n=1 Tax=Homarus americanus TaxID=6706 RepID=UPI001C48BB90|nr:LOW QUALITY PROTEIN: uncharacterized protein LOC121866992 [Homarus americanus]